LEVPLNFMVLRSRYAIMANRWFAGWLQEKTLSVKLCRVWHSSGRSLLIWNCFHAQSCSTSWISPYGLFI